MLDRKEKASEVRALTDMTNGEAVPVKVGTRVSVLVGILNDNNSLHWRFSILKQRKRTPVTERFRLALWLSLVLGSYQPKTV